MVRFIVPLLLSLAALLPTPALAEPVEGPDEPPLPGTLAEQ